MTTLPPICRALAMGLNEEFEKMKTPQEAAREYAETLWNRESTLEWDVSRDACEEISLRTRFPRRRRVWLSQGFCRCLAMDSGERATSGRRTECVGERGIYIP